MHDTKTYMPIDNLASKFTHGEFITPSGNTNFQENFLL